MTTAVDLAVKSVPDTDLVELLRVIGVLIIQGVVVDDCTCALRIELEGPALGRRVVTLHKGTLVSAHAIRYLINHVNYFFQFGVAVVQDCLQAKQGGRNVTASGFLIKTTLKL